MYSGEPFRRECVVYGAQCRLAQQPFVHGLAQDAKGGNTERFNGLVRDNKK
jgi:hypothetical protein